MIKPRKKLGVIVAVDGNMSEVGMYNMSNDAEFIWYGEVLADPKIGAFLTINQNNIKIIATVSTEKIIDQQNTVKSEEFDNRYSKNSINRIVLLKTKGVIENKKFQVTSQYVPMIGNEVTLTTRDELEIIYDVNGQKPSITIGKSMLEGQLIRLSIDNFFASHIGVFGNTGSGKSNTLHKLYLELFRSSYREQIILKSQFFVIDFNGEYVGENIFALGSENKIIYNVITRNETRGQKIPVKKEYLFDADILAILFDARPATQVPFLRQAIAMWNKRKFKGKSFACFVVGTIKKILTTGNEASSEAKSNWITVAKEFIFDENVFSELDSLDYYSKDEKYKCLNGAFINKNTVLSESLFTILKIDKIQEKIAMRFDDSDEISKLKIHLEFQKVHQSAWGSVNIKYISPLFHRITSSLNSLEKVIEVKEELVDDFKTMNIISLVNANQEITRLIPMLLSKMIYDEQKVTIAGNKVNKTKHLIIDEAHNILNAEYRNNGDDWQDYRLSVFEEIVKEGRKFGFYLTLSSQRPADISATILSQTHNYFIHRLVNEKDLRMLENTMPTLDKSTYGTIPSLGQGEAIITGNAMQVPVLVKVEKEETNRPNSDDVQLTELWEFSEVEEFDIESIF